MSQEDDYKERLTFIRYSWWFIALVFMLGLLVGVLI